LGLCCKAFFPGFLFWNRYIVWQRVDQRPKVDNLAFSLTICPLLLSNSLSLRLNNSYLTVSMNATIIALIIPFLGTALGSAFVFFMKKDMPDLLQKILLGFASGVMVAASVWSLLIPGMEMGGIWPATIGLLGGFAFLLLIDRITPHLHPVGGPEGPKSKLSKTTMLALAVTIHNFPEGMAVGVAIAGALSGGAGMTAAGALALSLGIAIQNVPEGAIISMPLRAAGNSRWRAFGVGALSGVVEPIGGALVILLASAVTPMMPYLLAFAAGAMLYVVVEELVPEASQGEHSNIATVGFALGFALMMVLDVLMG
jgi:ZIP family zinc transporter